MSEQRSQEIRQTRHASLTVGAGLGSLATAALTTVTSWWAAFVLVSITALLVFRLSAAFFGWIGGEA